MRNVVVETTSCFAIAMLLLAGASAAAQDQIAENTAAKSPWGPTDEIGTLNMRRVDRRG